MLGVVTKFQHFKELVQFRKSPVHPEMSRNDEQIVSIRNGSVDVTERPVHKTKSGGWKASGFILVFVFCETLAYISIALSMIFYLTSVLQEGIATSVKNVNYWAGTTCVMPLIGGFIADVYCERYKMVLISSAIYILGLVSLILAVSLPSLKANSGVYFFSLYLISIGMGGHKPSLTPFGADQFDEEDKTEMLQKISFFNHWFLWLSAGFTLAVTVIAYVQENVSWGFGYGIVTVAMCVATLLFLCGTPLYRHKVPRGSPITGIAQVVVAAIRKRDISMPSDITLLYEKDKDVEFIKSGRKLLVHTDNFQFLDKAAIMVADSSEGNTDTGRTKEPNPWYICPVTQVEETKLILRIAPIWFSCLFFGMTFSLSISLFLKQGSTMDRKLGSHFQVPVSSLMAVQPLSALVSVVMFNRFIVPLARRITGNERGITVLQRIGVGFIVLILSIVTAALTENIRVHVAKTHDLLDRPTTPIPLSVFCLIPQFFLIGVAESFTAVALQEYFYDQVPDGMSSFGTAFNLSIMGVGSFLGSFLVIIVEGVTKRGGHPGWLGNNLNRSRIDYFYWLLAVIEAINLCCYIYLAKNYKYKKVMEITSIPTQA